MSQRPCGRCSPPPLPVPLSGGKCMLLARRRAILSATMCVLYCLLTSKNPPPTQAATVSMLHRATAVSEISAPRARETCGLFHAFTYEDETALKKKKMFSFMTCNQSEKRGESPGAPKGQRFLPGNVCVAFFVWRA